MMKQREARLTVVLLVLLITMATGYGFTPKKDILCMQEGGECVPAGSCHGRMINGTGLCGSTGRDCCNNHPNEPRQCHARGGECMKKSTCKNSLNHGQLDCKKEMLCCHLE